MFISRFTTQAVRTAGSIAALVLPALSFVAKRDISPFDGQYIHPNSSNEAVEWWWGQAIANPEGDNPPAAFQFLFYQGYAFGPHDPLLPEYYIAINGFFPNGTKFATTLPAISGKVTTSHEEVTGTWSGAGAFKGSADLSTFTVTLNAPSAGFEGTVKLTSNAGHHFGCNSTTDPYFSTAIPSGTKLSAAETLLYTQLGWATTIPGAVSDVNMMINGSKLHFKGLGYHDANWSPLPLNAAISTWYFGQAQVGEYDFSYISVTAVNSTKILNTGYLSRGGVVLQNQCSVDGTKHTDKSIISPYGLQNDTVAGDLDVPSGFIVDYVLANGETFKFNLSSVGGVQNPDQNVYHRWVGTATGGKVGESPSSGLTVFEWLNPGLVNYNP